MSDLNQLAEQLSQLTVRQALQVAQLVLAKAGFTSGEARELGCLVDVVLQGYGYSKINVIKVVRELTGLGLKDAKDLVEGAPSVIVSGVRHEEAEKMVQKLIEAGGTAQVGT